MEHRLQVLKFLESPEMHITHYGLGLKGIDALLCALNWNNSVSVLRLTYNNIPGLFIVGYLPAHVLRAR